MAKTNYISIPKGLPTAIIKDDLERYVVTYYRLKALYVGGVIKDYRKRGQEIADTFGIGHSTLRSHISRLKELGWCYRKGNHLFLVSRERLREQFNCSKSKYTTTTDNLLEWLKAKAIQENLNKQQYTYVEKYIQSITKESKATSKIGKAIRKSINKDFEAHLSIMKKRFNSNIKEGKSNVVNPYITLSRQGIASCLNRKSKRTGTYQLNKLKKLGLIVKDIPNLVFINMCSYSEYLREKSFTGINYVFNKGKMYLRLSNEIVIVD